MFDKFSSDYFYGLMRDEVDIRDKDGSDALFECRIYLITICSQSVPLGHLWTEPEMKPVYRQ